MTVGTPTMEGASPQPAPAEVARNRDDLMGQNLIVFMRWVLVICGVIITLWDPGDGANVIDRVRAQVTMLFILAIGNFALHAQVLMKRDTAPAIGFVASWIDLGIIMGLIWLNGGYLNDSYIYIFFFPALLAIGVAFPLSMSVFYIGMTLAIYTMFSIFPATAKGQLIELVIRLMMLAAVAGVGVLYRQLEEQRRARYAGMLDADQATAREEAEDIYHGQTVIVWARWAVVLGAAVLALWTVDTMEQIIAGTALVLVMTGMNCFLHLRLLIGKPANGRLLLAVGLVDLALIGTLALVMPGARGLAWQGYTLLYPLILASAFVFRPRLALGYTALVLVIYSLACVLTGSVQSSAELKLLVLRLITFATMGGLGAYYWRLIRIARRRAANEPAVDPMAQFDAAV